MVKNKNNASKYIILAAASVNRAGQYCDAGSIMVVGQDIEEKVANSLISSGSAFDYTGKIGSAAAEN